MNDRRPIWTWIVAALVGLPLLYVVSFGPACWFSERMGRGANWVSTTYRPIIWLGNRSALGTTVIWAIALRLSHHETR